MDSVSAQLDAVANIDTYVQVADIIISAGSYFYINCDEFGIATDTVTNTTTQNSDIAETANITDSVTNTVDAVAFISETAVAVATVSANVTMYAVIAETAQAFDTITQRLLWELIDDNQNVSWQVIY